MENYQNPIIIQDPVKQPASTGLQAAALVLGIIGFVMSFISYFSALFGNIMRAVSYRGGSAPAGGIIVIVLAVITMLLCAAAIILGAVGIVRSTRRPRTVKGIVFSAVGLATGLGGLIFAFISLFVNGIFSAIIDNARYL